MNFIKDLSIPQKLSLLLFLLIVPLVFFLYWNVNHELESNRKIKGLLVSVENARALSNLIHELQAERGTSQLYLSTKGKFSRRLGNEQGLTDMSRKTATEVFSNNKTPFPGHNLFADIEIFRSRLMNREMDSLEASGYYTQIINMLINETELSPFLTDNVELRRQINAFQSLTLAKENLGQMRSIFARIYSSERITSSDHDLFIPSYSLFNEYFKAFEKVSPPTTINYSNQILSKREIVMVDSLLESFSKNTFVYSSSSPLVWYNRFTIYMNSLKDVENFILNKSIERAHLLLRQNTKKLIIYFSVSGIMVLLGLILAFYIVELISNSIYELKSVADSVARGRTDVALLFTSNDELGQLATSFRSVIKSNLQLSRVANCIGEGNYEANPEIRDEKDTLGIALKQMRDNLLEFSKKEKKNNWMLTGDSKLNDILRGERELHLLADKLLNFLCDYLYAQTGAFYVLEDTELIPLASVAISLEEIEQEGKAINVGLLKQAMVSRKMIHLQRIPDGYFQIRSGLGRMTPKNILIIPLMSQQKVIGIVEVGSIENFSDLHIEFLDIVSEKIAIVIESTQAHNQTRQLLENSQRQAEELEFQKGELKQLNFNLNEQRLRLQASEEELKTSQEELQEKNVELEEKAQQLEEQYEMISYKNRELEQAREAIQIKVEQLERTSKYKSEFLANMSHELRTPLNSILILSKLLEENKEKNLNSKQIEFASVIHRSGNDLLTLINDILDLSKIESGRVKIKNEKVKLNELTMNWQFDELAKSRKLNYNVTLDPALPNYIVTDRFKTEQILKNLLSNAFKFTPAGGSVYLKIYPSKFNNKEMIAFEVKDTGIGIPKKNHQLIFKAFQQLDSSTTRQYKGTGLGLSISQELSYLLGGDILLESEEGKGATFTLFIPLEPLEETPKKVPSALAAQKSVESISFLKTDKDYKGRTLLIIDDDMIHSAILEEFAFRQQYNVLVAYNGKKGYEMAKELKPNAILLDINLPDMTGWEVLDMIRKNEDLKDTPVHIISANKKDKNLNTGETSYFTKPIDFDVLKKSLEQFNKTSPSIKKVLIVEDDQDQNEAIKALLEDNGLNSYSAFSAQEAESLLKNEPMDCVILDLSLPDMNGEELLEKLKKTNEFEKVPFIVYSAKVLSGEEEKKIRKYASTIVIKTGLSYKRLVDEVNLFIKDVEENLLQGKGLNRLKTHYSDNLKGKKVLLVDDDIRNIFSLHNVLEQYEMSTLTADNGAEAIEKLEAHPDTDIILMDLMMPVMDGYEAIQKIRQQEKFRNTPIIALTAKAMKGDREKCIQAGASDYIAKPIDPDKLLSLMRVWLYDKK